MKDSLRTSRCSQAEIEVHELPVVNVACPYCGHETLAFVPDGKKIADVHRLDGSLAWYESEAACQKCSKSFHVRLRDS